jgi:hypothetical protein
LYFFSLALASDELDIDITKIRKAFKLLCERKFCKWDEDRRVVWVVNMWKRQGKAGVHFDRLQNHFLTLNNTPLVAQFLSRYSSYNIPVTKLSLPCHDDVTDLNESAHHEQEQEQEQDKNPLPPRKGNPKVSHEVEVIKAELEKVDLPKTRQDFPNKDVNATWEEFYECCISGTAKKPWPNPYNYVDFGRGFLTWVRKREDQKPTKKTWRDA